MGKPDWIALLHCRKVVRWLVFGTSCIITCARADIATCGDPFKNSFGPFDYRLEIGTAHMKDVEASHFTPEVESLKGGHQGTLGADLDYVLRAYPNHPRALLAMMRYALASKTPRARGLNWPFYCYFERAVTYQPKDPMARVIAGTYLLRVGHKNEAREQLDIADQLADSGNVHYNLGLAYFELGEYAKAREHAKAAAELGFDLPGLRKKLVDVGQWPADQ